MLQRLKVILVNFLKGAAVKVALKKILGSMMAGGIKGWIIRYTVEHLFDEVAKPFINYAFRRMGYAVKYHQGKIVIKEVTLAKQNNDIDAYRRSIGRV